MPPPRARGRTNRTSSCAEPSATCKYQWRARAWRCGRMAPIVLELAHRVLSIDDKRDRELPCHLSRPARRPAARPPISIARAVGKASAPPPRAARSDARRLEAARAIDEGAFLPADAGDRARASSHSADRSRAGRLTAQAAAPNRALRGVSMASAASSRRPNASANAEPSLSRRDPPKRTKKNRPAPVLTSFHSAAPVHVPRPVVMQAIRNGPSPRNGAKNDPVSDCEAEIAIIPPYLTAQNGSGVLRAMDRWVGGDTCIH